MKTIFAILAFSIGALAQAKVISVPLSVSLDGLYTAGTNTYLSLYASPEVDSQIAKACGTDAVLLNLELHYIVQQGQTGAGVSTATLAGSATCRTNTN